MLGTFKKGIKASADFHRSVGCSVHDILDRNTDSWTVGRSTFSMMGSKRPIAVDAEKLQKHGFMGKRER